MKFLLPIFLAFCNVAMPCQSRYGRPPPPPFGFPPMPMMMPFGPEMFPPFSPMSMMGGSMDIMVLFEKYQMKNFLEMILPRLQEMKKYLPDNSNLGKIIDEITYAIQKYQASAPNTPPSSPGTSPSTSPATLPSQGGIPSQSGQQQYPQTPAGYPYPQPSYIPQQYPQYPQQQQPYIPQLPYNPQQQSYPQGYPQQFPNIPGMSPGDNQPSMVFPGQIPSQFPNQQQQPQNQNGQPTIQQPTSRRIPISSASDKSESPNSPTAQSRL